MAVPKQKSINRIRRQREFFNKKKEEKREEKITIQEHEERVNKLKEMGLLK